MGVPKCEVCSITLSAIDVRSHVNGKKHQRKLVQFKDAGKAIPGENGIQIRDSPPRQAEVNQRAVGEVRAPVEANTSRPVMTQNDTKAPPGQPGARYIPVDQVKKRPNRDRPKRKLAKDDQNDAKCVVPPAQVDTTKPFAEQVNDFIAQVEQTDAERIKIKQVLYDVARTFSRVMPGVMPVLYGSQATGLAYRTSDIDVYLFNPRGDEERDFVRLNGKEMYRSRLFTNIVIIGHARVPVIKAKHIETGIDLDISATSSQAMHNSALLSFVMCHDSRVRKLLMLIGYWAKKSNLISVNKFSRYSINLLVIFYLQNLKFRILPPAAQLIYRSQYKIWPTHVTQNVSLLHNRNYSSLHNLFIGFFEFYHTFPFTENVISIFLGKKIPSGDLEKPEVINSMPYYQMNLAAGGEKLQQRTVCIQDPLELNHNTSKQVTLKTVKQLESACKKMLELREKFRTEDWMEQILNGEVAKPVPEPRKAQEFSFSFEYKTANDWTQAFKNDLTKALTLFNINTGSNLPFTGDLKKTKFNNDCIKFSVESQVYPFTPQCRRILLLLKNKTVDYDFFLKELKSLGTPPAVPKYNFSAQCFVKSLIPDRVTLQFTNECDPVSFFKTVSNLKLLDCVVSCINSTRESAGDNKNCEENTVKTNPSPANENSADD